MTPRIDPVAEAFAKANNIDISNIKGSGPDGEITPGDVTEALEEQAKARLAQNKGCLAGLFGH